MIDSKSLTYSGFDKILAACRLDSPITSFKLCMNSFPKLLELYKKEAHVEDNIFEEIKFPIDADITTKNIRRIASINQE